MRMLLLVLLLGGCTGSTAPLPYQAEYLDVVWHKIYGMQRNPPEIEWIATDDWTIAGESYDGFTWAGWKVQVACGSRCDQPIEQSDLAHELMHMRTFDRTGDVDAYHWRGDWDLAWTAMVRGAAQIYALRKAVAISHATTAAFPDTYP